LLKVDLGFLDGLLERTVMRFAANCTLDFIGAVSGAGQDAAENIARRAQ
jgi:hypothetical protein